VIPEPISWAWDQVTGFLGDAAGAGFEMVVQGLVAWVVGAVIWVVGGVFNFFRDAADPNVQADWFVTGDGPYATTSAIGGVLLVGFVFAGITQGVLAGDVGGMVRRMGVDLPVSVLGMVGLVTVTQALIRLTDELSTQVMSNFEQDITDFIATVTSLSSFTGSTALVVVLLGLVTVIAGLILFAELAVRGALIYIVVALAPLVFAARLWPALQGMCRKLLDLLVALILSKLVIAVALAVAASAAVGSGSGGEVTALPEPEVMAEDPGGSMTQAVGILLAAAAAFGVAAFSPLLVARLLPLTEAAIVAQGVRSGPLRAGQQALSMAYSAQMVRAPRLRQLAAGRSGSGEGGAGRSPLSRAAAGPAAGSTGSAGSGGAAAGAAGAGAAAGPVGVVAAAAGTGRRAATRAVRRGVRAATDVAAAQAGGGGSPGTPTSGRRGVEPVPNQEQVPARYGRRIPNEPHAPAPPLDWVPPQPRRTPPTHGGRRGQ
jgi:hypothetical protein